ncbi:MAG: hypothetical protein MI723_03525, partial [Caulobacterales bacterium]|nr:hypothetical protein [Caulobacterales bacterium]
MTMANERTLGDEFASLEQKLADRFPKSMEQHRRSRQWMPGGVSRGVQQVDPFPICVERASDGRLSTIDGETLINFSGDYSSGLYGHSNPLIVAAAHEAVDAGFSFGATSSYEGRLAELFCTRQK